MDLEEVRQLEAKSYEEINEFCMRAALEAAQKLRRLQQERNPGGNEYWPWVLFLWIHHKFLN